MCSIFICYVVKSLKHLVEENLGHLSLTFKVNVQSTIYIHAGLAEKSFIAKNASVAFGDVTACSKSVYFRGLLSLKLCRASNKWIYNFIWLLVYVDNFV